MCVAVSLSLPSLRQSAMWTNKSLCILRVGCFIECLLHRGKGKHQRRMRETQKNEVQERQQLTGAECTASELFSKVLVNIWNGLQGLSDAKAQRDKRATAMI